MRAIRRYPRGKGHGVALDRRPKSLEIGRGELLREGDDVVIVAIGSTVVPSLQAAKKLAEQGIHAAVVNARFVKPLDSGLILRCCEEVGRLVTVEENDLEGAFGSAVLELLQARGLFSVAVKRLGIPDVFVEHGSRDQLLQVYGIDSQGIFNGVMEWIEGDVRRKKKATVFDLKTISPWALRSD